MIDTLFFALQIIGIGVLLGWAVIHDKFEDDAPVHGPLAFKQPEGGEAEGRSNRRNHKHKRSHRSRTRLSSRTSVAKH